MQNGNFHVIFGWMCNELNLSGNELLVYSAIYGFSKDGSSVFTGSRKYLSESFNITLPTVDKALKGLMEKGYICRNQKEINGVVFNEYYADLSIFQNFTGCKESLPGVVKNLYGGSKESLPNNINNNINNNIDSFKEKNSKKKFNPNEILDSVDLIRDNAEIKKAFLDFIEMRKNTKFPINTERCLKLLINDAFKYGKTPDGIIKVIDQSIKNGWRGIFALKAESSYNAPRTPQTPQKSVMEQLDDMLAECEGESEFGANTALLEA